MRIACLTYQRNEIFTDIEAFTARYGQEEKDGWESFITIKVVHQFQSTQLDMITIMDNSFQKNTPFNRWTIEYHRMKEYRSDRSYYREVKDESPKKWAWQAEFIQSLTGTPFAWWSFDLNFENMWKLTLDQWILKRQACNMDIKREDTHVVGDS